MTLSESFHAGGPFMWVIAVCALGVLGVTVWKAIQLFGATANSGAGRRKGLALIMHLGMLGFFLGILGQAVGLTSALKAIQAAADVSPAIIIGGLRVSFITPIFGLLVLIVALLASAVLRYRADSLDEGDE